MIRGIEGAAYFTKDPSVCDTIFVENMPQAGTTKPEDSLFSLELVVEKVYIPHTPCRFPAIAFRLLDYPTIIIKHVEDDLGSAIRKKISFDPYYQLPDQFIELKDKHGNFMVKKGKSCLFRISADILKQHLANTPMYVMVIDLFPEVPKLVGNSTVPLNSLMDSICVDIAKLGPTVPSVHGDKGLFKLYNLMGKEIGYFVLGFRLLCLGPSLIPHLPESALLHRHTKGKQTKEIKKVDDMIKKRENISEEEDSDECAIELRNSASMTDPIKHDVLLQTVEMEDKAIHVAVSGVDSQTETKPMPEKESQSISTQTEKKIKAKIVQSAKQKWVEHVEHKIDDDDEIIINNIVCPPPLFYNSEAAPSIKIDRAKSQQGKSTDDMSVDDLSDIESYDGFGLEKEKSFSKADDEDNFHQPPPAVTFQHKTGPSASSAPLPQARVGERVQGLQVAPQPDAVFPLLTALLNELSSIQNPQLLLQVSNQVQAASYNIKKPSPAMSESKPKQGVKDDKLSPSVVSAVAAALTKRVENAKENIEKQSPEKPPSQQTSPPKTSKQTKISKADQSASKQSPTRSSRKGKLVYGMTHTQRLRLQKTNPQWLKAIEKEVSDIKGKKQPVVKKPDLDDVNATTFSDTLTEVRRLAEKELNSTAGGDTLVNIASEVEILESTVERKETKQFPQKKQRSTSRENQVEKKSMKDSPSVKPAKRRSVQSTPSPKARSKTRHRRVAHRREVQESSDSDEPVQRRPVPLERHISGITSPALILPDNDNEDQLSVRSDLPSSRSRSIEVRLPSAEPDVNDSATITDAEDDDDDIPLPDDSVQGKTSPQGVNLPRYFSRDTSLPESIEGTANASVNISGVLDDNSPMESTRHSKNLTSDQNDSRVLQQSTDYDTRQFHSTDEPELQGLVSEEENRSEGGNSGRRSAASVRTSQKFPVINPQLSENSPVPSVRRSTSKLDPGVQSHLPSMSFSKGGGSPVSSRPTTPKGRMTSSTDLKFQTPNLKSGNMTGKMNITPRSTSSSPRRPTPRARRPLRESIHTDSLSSYMPSDPENVIVSLSSNSGNYSDDFQPLGSADSAEGNSMIEQLPRIIPSAKLGYTIN